MSSEQQQKFAKALTSMKEAYSDVWDAYNTSVDETPSDHLLSRLLLHMRHTEELLERIMLVYEQEQSHKLVAIIIEKNHPFYGQYVRIIKDDDGDVLTIALLDSNFQGEIHRGSLSYYGWASEKTVEKLG